MGRRSFARSVAPRIRINEEVKQEEKERERQRIKEVMAERKKARANLKKINDKIIRMQDKESKK